MIRHFITNPPEITSAMVFRPAVGNSQTDTFAGKAAEFRYHTHRKITNRHYPFSTVVECTHLKLAPSLKASISRRLPDD
jgi:hypothetical protein